MTLLYTFFQAFLKRLNFPILCRLLCIHGTLGYWDQLSAQEVIDLRDGLALNENKSILSLRANVSLKHILEKLGVEHSLLTETELIITDDEAKILLECLDLSQIRHKEIPGEGWSNTIELVSKLAGVEIKNKSSTFVGVRVGRPEKAMPRKMRPPVQGLFPVGKSTGMSRDILVAADKTGLLIEIVNSECPKCGTRTITAKCPLCDSNTILFKVCAQCGTRVDSGTRCAKCGGQLRYSSPFQYPIKQEVRKASLRVDYAPQKPLKGVLGLTNELKIPERLEKVLLETEARPFTSIETVLSGLTRRTFPLLTFSRSRSRQILRNSGRWVMPRTSTGILWREMIRL